MRLTTSTNSLEYKERTYLSVSTLLDFKRCPRRFFYRKLGLTSRVEPTALIYGSAMHKAVPIAVTEGIKPAIAAFLSVWGKTVAKDTMNVERAIASLSHFIHTHEGRKSIYKFLPPPSGALEVEDLVSDYEVPWILDIELDIPLVGRIDALVEHRDTGELWGWEFKTVGRSVGSYFFESFEMNIQILTYALALLFILPFYLTNYVDAPTSDVECVYIGEVFCNRLTYYVLNHRLPVTTRG